LSVKDLIRQDKGVK